MDRYMIAAGNTQKPVRPILFDTRWEGSHGIGRVAAEMQTRVLAGIAWRSPARWRSHLNPLDPIFTGLWLKRESSAIFYTPGFNPPLLARDRSIFTLHDLIHLRVPEESGVMKRSYYKYMVKPAVHQAYKVLTVSEFSRRDIVQWSGVKESSVLNVGNGVDPIFFDSAAPVPVGYPYLLYVGGRKPHKNLPRLLQAYSACRSSRELYLVLSGVLDRALMAQAGRLGISDRLRFAGPITEADLPSYYQGATAFLFPSYFEGFGLPPVEAMAGGTPTLTSNTTALPEVVGSAALTVDPFSIDAMAAGIDELVFNSALRSRLRVEGPVQAKRHSWDTVANKVSRVLHDLSDTL